jgi:hypothetical protein
MIGAALLTDRRRGPLLGVIGAALFVTAGILGWSARGSLVSHDKAPTADAWALPKRPNTDTEADAAILRARRPWGGSAAFRDAEAVPAAPVAPASSPWRFVGTVVRDNESFALIEIGKELKYLGTGDALPDNGIVMRIEQDSIVVQGPPGSPAGAITYRLFHKNS